MFFGSYFCGDYSNAKAIHENARCYAVMAHQGVEQHVLQMHSKCILLTKTAAALSYHRLRGLFFLAVVFVRSIDQKSLLVSDGLLLVDAMREKKRFKSYFTVMLQRRVERFWES